jgi:hypothetical protein
MHVYSKSTSLNGVLLAKSYKSYLTDNSNTYVGLGQCFDWGTKPEALDTIENLNTVFRNLIVIKKIGSSDICQLVPDNYWTSGLIYDQFNSDEEMYTHETKSLLTGKIDYTSGSNTVTGNLSSTFFLTEIVSGDVLEFSGLDADEHKIHREVVQVVDNYTALINTSISTTYSNSSIYKVSSSYPRYAKTFYVRNSYDQVFLCLYNNTESKSTIEPVLRPENFSIGKLIQDNEDGYVWRYLYTVPSGLKEKFLYTDREGIKWVPVVADTIVSESAVNGALEHIRIYYGGKGFNSNTPNTSADILTVEGDGSGAVFTANVQISSAFDSTTITEILTGNSGENYTYATITATGGTGAIGANLVALISPVDGFGYDPTKDLGAKFLGISVGFSGTESNTLPISTNSGNVKFRQISIIKDPKYSNGEFVSISSVAMTSTVTADITIAYDAVATVGDRFEQSSGFTGNVVGFYSGTTDYLLLNNTKGTFSNTVSANFLINDAYSGTASRISTPDIQRSGDILYVENVDEVSRNSTQYEQIKLVLKF